MLFKKIFLILILVLGLFLAFHSIFALEIDWPRSPMGTPLNDVSTLTDLVKYFYEWGIALGGLAAFIALLIAGFLYLTSIGDPQKMADARGRIVSAFFGLVLLLASWIILNTINPDLTVLVMPPTDPGKIPNLLCDDKCAKYTDKTSCKGDVDCSWDKSYCYNKKCEIYSSETSCSAAAEGCAWDESEKYCYRKNGCFKGYACVNDPNPGDGEKQGFCEPPPENQKPICTYARVWTEKKFTPPVSSPILVDDTGTIPSGNTTLAIRSAKAFFDDSAYDEKCSQYNTAGAVACSNNPSCNWNENTGKCYQFCGEDGCGCTLQMYDAPSCVDGLGQIIAYSTNMEVYYEKGGWFTDGKIDCVKVLSP